MDTIPEWLFPLLSTVFTVVVVISTVVFFRAAASARSEFQALEKFLNDRRMDLSRLQGELRQQVMAFNEVGLHALIDSMSIADSNDAQERLYVWRLVLQALSNKESERLAGLAGLRSRPPSADQLTALRSSPQADWSDEAKKRLADVIDEFQDRNRRDEVGR